MYGGKRKNRKLDTFPPKGGQSFLEEHSGTGVPEGKHPSRKRSGHPRAPWREVNRMMSKIRHLRRIAMTLAPLVGLLLAGGANANWR